MKKPSFKKAIRRIMTIFGIILSVGLIPILIVNITIIVKSYVNPNKVPSFLGYKPFIVLSDSMNPDIHAGDLVLTQDTKTADLAVGEVISYRIGDSVVTHRIVAITETEGVRSFTTRGDANNTDDTKPVDESQIEGALLLTIPKLGNTALFLQTPFGMLICIGVPVFMLVAYDILRRRRYDREKNRKTLELEQELELMRAQVHTN